MDITKVGEPDGSLPSFSESAYTLLWFPAIIPCDASQEDDSGWILDDVRHSLQRGVVRELTLFYQDLNRILVKSLGTVDCRLVVSFPQCPIAFISQFALVGDL